MIPLPLKRETGFSLVELLVVIGIVCVLAAVALSVSGSIRTKAGSVASLSNLRQISQAYFSASTERNNEVIWGLDYDTSRGGSLQRMWCTALLPYLGADTVDFSSPDAYYRSLPKIFLSPSDQKNRLSPCPRSYAPNYEAYSPQNYNRAVDGRMRFTRLSNRSQLILICEWATGGASQSSFSLATTDLPDFYRNDTANMLFADGHVEQVLRPDVLPGGGRIKAWSPVWK